MDLSILFFEVFFETTTTKSRNKVTRKLSILFFEVFFETDALAFPYPPNQTNFQSSFLRFSLKLITSQAKKIVKKKLSILFFEVFFETRLKISRSVLYRILLSILFFEVFFETIYNHHVTYLQQRTFNPLFWGFLWNNT